MSFQFLITAALTGLISAAAFVPWSMTVQMQAAAGQQADLTLAYVGYALAGMAWITAGGLVTRKPVVRPYLAGPFAGFIAAAVSAWLVWLPAVNVWSLHELWAAAAASDGSAPPAAEVVGSSTSLLLHYSVLGFWAHSALGALMGLVGTLFTHRFRKGTPVPIRIPALWPLRTWVWSVALVIAGLVALQQTEFDMIWTSAIGHGPLEPLQLLLINGAILGLLVAAPVGAVGVRYIRSDLPVLRRVGMILYITLFIASGLMWVGVVPLLAPDAAGPTPFFGAYCAAPLVGLLFGGLFGWRDPAPPIPRVSDMFAEMALLFLITGPLVAGAGLGAAAWSSVMGPLVWGNVLAGASRWSSLELTVAEVLAMQALAWGPILGVVLLEGPLVVMPALIMIRRSAMRQAEARNARMVDAEPMVEVEYDATVPRMALGLQRKRTNLVDPQAKTVAGDTEVPPEVELETDAEPTSTEFVAQMPTEPISSSPDGEPDDVRTEQVEAVDSKTRVSSASDV